MTTRSFPKAFHVEVALWRCKHLPVVTTLSLLCPVGHVCLFLQADLIKQQLPPLASVLSFYLPTVNISELLSLKNSHHALDLGRARFTSRDVASISLSTDINHSCFCFYCHVYLLMHISKASLMSQRSQISTRTWLLFCFPFFVMHGHFARARRCEQKPFLNKSHQTSEFWWCGKG